MLLHRCSVCGREYLPAGVYASWYRNIGRMSEHILKRFCACKEPMLRSERFMYIDYKDVVDAIVEVGRWKASLMV